ncbi:glycosyltransferase [Sulfurimonas sp.]|uniref:glycosyltransferase n=1 Tax=Sulfurimonas sp. TaxID=2022749 RepID=UPI0026193963|nr:glycosyltransferase [Sulfurimonas sp.]
MKVSIIIAVYKDITALNLIIEALKIQTYKNFEVIVAEDNNSFEMKEYINSVKEIDIKHTFQEDKGVRKSKSQNNGILKSSGEYLIFLDGDIIPYSTFVAGHIALAKEGVVLAGRRANLNARLSKKFREGTLNPYSLQKHYLTLGIELMFDKNTRYEQGIYINPNSFIYKYFISTRKRNTSLIGCNFSCFKKDMVAINGFDESYGESSLPDDVDLDWRFRAYGLKLLSCKNVANAFHLFHKKQNNQTTEEQRKRFEKNQKENIYVCKKGLNQHIT